MKRHRCRTILAHALAASTLALAVCASSHAQGILAARVNGSPIPLELLDRQFEELLRERGLRIVQMRSPDKAKSIKREALDHLIRIELLWQVRILDGAEQG